MEVKIYIADDYWETTNLIMDALEHNNYIFSVAKNGKELLEIIDLEGNPDLLILDLWMPVMDGFSVLKKIQDKAKYDSPVLVVTALSEHSKIRQAYELGANDVIIKPFFVEDLKIRANKLINENKVKKELERSIHILNGSIHDLQYGSLVSLCKVVEAKDGLIGKHVDRVGETSYQIAKIMGLEQKICEMIKYAAKVHDIGKIAIPDSILQKPNKLTEQEFEVIKSHTTKGLEMIVNLKHNPIFSFTGEIVLYHHEHYNGNGYPYGWKGRDIPLSARITAVADVFDALTHKRVYKEAWSADQAIEHISRLRESQFDPEVVDAFLLNVLQTSTDTYVC